MVAAVSVSLLCVCVCFFLFCVLPMNRCKMFPFFGGGGGDVCVRYAEKVP